MANSKHVEEVLGVLRNNTLIAVTKGDLDIKVLSLDPYPEETNWVISLANGKKITTDDIEFSDLILGESEIKIHLGDYIFHLARGKAE
jgi:hypothetical protein